MQGLTSLTGHMNIRFGSVPAGRDVREFFSSEACYAVSNGRVRPEADFKE